MRAVIFYLKHRTIGYMVVAPLPSISHVDARLIVNTRSVCGQGGVIELNRTLEIKGHAIRFNY